MKHTRFVKPLQGFTLVELLVVLAIIGLLIGILLPALGSAQNTARSIQCASNMRQVAVGYATYSVDYNGIGIPGRMAKRNPDKSHPDNYYPVGNGMQYRPRWFITMGGSAGFYAYRQPSGMGNFSADNSALVDGGDVFICPQAPQRINNRNYAYGYNYQFLGNTRRYTNHFVNFPVLTDMLNGAQTVLAADSLGTAANFPRSARTAYQVDGSKVLDAVSNHGWALDPPRLTTDSDSCDNENPGIRSAPDPRHQQRSNFSFIDGHVQTADPADLGYSTNPNGAYNFSNGAHNRFFSGTGRDDDPPPIN